MTDKKDSTINNILGYAFKNKLSASITGVVYLLIYKVIDMNTIQWFGDDIFIRNGNVLEFIICAALVGALPIFILSIIAEALKGKLF